MNNNILPMTKNNNNNNNNNNLIILNSILDKIRITITSKLRITICYTLRFSFKPSRFILSIYIYNQIKNYFNSFFVLIFINKKIIFPRTNL